MLCSEGPDELNLFSCDPCRVLTTEVALWEATTFSTFRNATPQTTGEKHSSYLCPHPACRGWTRRDLEADKSILGLTKHTNRALFFKRIFPAPRRFPPLRQQSRRGRRWKEPTSREGYRCVWSKGLANTNHSIQAVFVFSLVCGRVLHRITVLQH